MAKNAEKERLASWLELFYDLVFAAVSQIGLSLHDNTNSIRSFLGNAALFALEQIRAFRQNFVTNVEQRAPKARGEVAAQEQISILQHAIAASKG